MSLPNGNVSAEIKEDKSIVSINKETVHKICSGQVVLSLAIAVKELVENAIDASATIIDVRLKEYGSEFVEVSDNGVGVKSENFQNLTLKHYTSKLREFSDLESVGTLGFRGEALSSLCALSDLTVITRHDSANYATKITYDHNGKITASSPAARDVGTTVILQNLFKSLPVRRKEFLKNLKREFNKMCQLMYAYCLVCKNIKITCSNQTNKGSKSTVVATLGSNTTRDNIISVFGPKQLPHLKEIDLVEPDETILREFDLKNVALGEPLPFKFEFFISNATHGSGRSTSDRQFFYVNSRPCEPQKVMKLINEVYRQFNANQYPFVFLNVEMERSFVDVNVTPDKRQIFLEKEKLLLAVIKASLLEAFKLSPSTLTMQNVHMNGIAKGIKRSLAKSEDDGFSKTSFLNKFKKSTETLHEKTDNRLTDTTSVSEAGTTSEKASRCVSSNDVVEVACKLIKQKNDRLSNDCRSPNFRKTNEKQGKLNVFRISRKSSVDDVSFDEQIASSSKCVERRGFDESNDYDNFKEGNESKDTLLIKKNYNNEILENENGVTINLSEESDESLDTVFHQNVANIVKFDLNVTKSASFKLKSSTITVRTSTSQIKESLKKSSYFEKPKRKVEVCFRSKITPAANEKAEQELKKVLTKEMFKKMAIIGQFNLGFIVTKLNSDLFIIDQHATDEKYNFEDLQRNTVLESQVLLTPKPLELSADNESVLIDNEEVFKKNGFSFLINKDAPATKKVLLVSIPMSKNVVFGKDDIDEMLFMLQENINPEICRPSRVRAMFASRACRKSVMIGCPLSQSDMRRLIDHMGEIDHPWNCPHGRPTIRHLINLDLIHKEDTSGIIS